jgi:hypothetical protein
MPCWHCPHLQLTSQCARPPSDGVFPSQSDYPIERSSSSILSWRITRHALQRWPPSRAASIARPAWILRGTLRYAPRHSDTRHIRAIAFRGCFRLNISLPRRENDKRGNTCTCIADVAGSTTRAYHSALPHAGQPGVNTKCDGLFLGRLHRHRWTCIPARHSG